MESDELLRSLFTTESLNVEIAVYLRQDSLSRIVVHTPAGLRLLEKHLDNKRMLEVVRSLDLLASYFQNTSE